MLLFIDIVARVVWYDAYAKFEREERTVMVNVRGWKDNAVVRKLRFGKCKVALLCSEWVPFLELAHSR